MTGVAVPRIRAQTIVEHKALVRSELIRAATKLFAAQGLAATSLGDVARLANVGRTTLFPNKQSLFLAVIDDYVPPRLEALVSGLPDIGTLDRLEALFAEAYALVVKEQEVAFIMFRVGRELPFTARETMWAALDPVMDEILRLCEAGVASGEIGGDDAPLLAQLVADLLTGGIDHLLGMENMAERAPAITRSRLRFLRHGLVN